MKARLFIVNPDTKATALANMEVSIKVPQPTGAQWNRTITDIVSDLMQVAIGDYIFLWESGTENIYGVYRAISNAYYVPGTHDDFLFRIKIDTAYSFDLPISEYAIINDPYMKNKLWNIIGKKVAGKSRGTTPLSPEETQFLIQSLIDINSNYTYTGGYTIHTPALPNVEIQFDLVSPYSNSTPTSLSSYAYAPIKVRERSEVHFEKALEGILNHLIKTRNSHKLNMLNIPIDNILWYANYLPYGLERSEIDYMIMESVDTVNVNKIDVIELMKSIIDIDHIRRCLQYAKWVSDSITNGKNIVRPILICGSKSLTSTNGFSNTDIQNALTRLPQEYGFNSVDVYTYELDGTDINFTQYP